MAIIIYMKILKHKDLIKSSDGQYIGVDKKGYKQYFTKLQCFECGCDIFRRTVDLKTTSHSYCSVECKKKYRIKHKLNKEYIIGKVYQTKQDNVVKIWSGKSWSYKKWFKCECCKKEILREYSSNRSGKQHFCDYECEYKFHHPKESAILNHKDEINFCYLMGLIATDGCVTYPSRGYSTGSYSATVCLQQKDSGLLYDIQQMFGGDFTYYESINTFNNEYTNTIMSKWSIHYKKFVLYLKSIGIKRNKSLSLNIEKYFNSLTHDQQKACIRGLLDGDGSICINKEGNLVVSFVSGSFKLCEMVFEFVNSIADSNNQIYTSNSNLTDSVNYSFNVSCNKALKICDELYKDLDIKNNLFLKRKYNNYMQIKHPNNAMSNIRFNYKPSKQYPNINERSIRVKNDLTYDYTLEQQWNELTNLNKRKGSFELSSTAYNKIVLSNQPHYYEIEKRLWKENKNGLRDRLLKNRLKYIYKNEFQINDKEILRGFKISGEYIGFTHFNPLWIKGFIDEYKINSIYDPTMGWGHRLLGSGEIKYIGNDLDIRTYNGCEQIRKTFNLTNKILYNRDCSQFIPKEDYESVFTCPPYYNTEIYQNKRFKDIADYKQWWDKTIKCSLKPGVKYFAYVINHEYKTILEDICLNNNLELLKIYELGRRLNHFQANANVTKCEYLYVFIPKK